MTHSHHPVLRSTRFGVSAIRGLVAAAAFCASPAFALLGDCGQPSTNGAAPVTGDSLFILKTAVQLKVCDLCVCDVNNSGKITSGDALVSLKSVVGQQVTLSCPACAVVSTTSTSTSTSTTTTTTGACPAQGGLDGVSYNEVYTCKQKFTGQSYFCSEQDQGDTIKFKHLGSGTYEARDVPDSGFLYTGTLTCTSFAWNATSPNGYTESGIWNFASDLSTFTGSSYYQANNSTYSGICNETGAASPTIPPNPPTLPPCL